MAVAYCYNIFYDVPSGEPIAVSYQDVNNQTQQILVNPQSNAQVCASTAPTPPDGSVIITNCGDGGSPRACEENFDCTGCTPY